MSQLSRKLRLADDSGLIYWCQGCEETHSINFGSGPGPRWGYNGNPNSPTFTPSVLVRSGHYAGSITPGKQCWCTWDADHPNEPTKYKCIRCHTFITDGMVQFLSDCSHALAGQTLPLPDLPNHLQDDPA